MIYEDWEQEILDIIMKRLHEDNLIIRHMHGTRYVSRSNGRGRPPRRPRLVTLASWINGKWTGKIPWDELATEVLGDHKDGQELKSEFNKLLDKRKF